MSCLWDIKFKTQNAKFILCGDKTNESFFLILLQNKYMLIVEILENT